MLKQRNDYAISGSCLLQFMPVLFILNLKDQNTQHISLPVLCASEMWFPSEKRTWSQCIWWQNDKENIFNPSDRNKTDKNYTIRGFI